MPKKRRRLVALMSAVVGGMVAVLAVGSPAYAADVQVEIRGIPDDISIGSGARLSATFSNNTDAAMTGVRAVVAITLDGASPDAIRVSREGGGELPRESSNVGSVVFVDSSPFDLQRNGGRGDVSRRYTVSFGGSVLPGRATITVAAVLGGQTVGSAQVTTNVVVGGGRGDRQSAPNTNPGFVPTFEAGPTYSLAPLPVAEQPSRVSASVPKALYVLGVLLMLMGAASLFLIFRPPGRASARVGGAGPHRLGGPSWHPRDSGGAQSWPAVRRPGPEQTQAWGNPPEASVPAGSTRPVRDAGPGEPLPPWLRP